jgi:hypothetical protein
MQSIFSMLIVLLAASLAVAQPITAVQDETILSGFLSCNGANGDRQCPFKSHYVELRKGQAYSMKLDSTELDASLMLEDVHGKQLAQDTDDFDLLPGVIVFRPQITGAYRLIVSTSAPLREGFYQITIREVPVLLNVEESLESTDAMEHECHLRHYDVQMTAGRRYIIDLKSDDFDPFVKLLGPQGAIVAFEDEGYTQRGARVVYMPTRTGTYRIVATSLTPRSTGAFTLSVSAEK